jgi:hypothetical protein
MKGSPDGTANPRRHETPDYDFGVRISGFRISIQSTYVPVRKSVWKVHNLLGANTYTYNETNIILI